MIFVFVFVFFIITISMLVVVVLVFVFPAGSCEALRFIECVLERSPVSVVGYSCVTTETQVVLSSADGELGRTEVPHCTGQVETRQVRLFEKGVFIICNCLE